MRATEATTGEGMILYYDGEPVDEFDFGSGIGANCAKTATLSVGRDPTLKSYRGSAVFERNRATGTSGGRCGTGCGGALYVHGYATADLDRVDFSRNSAADGGAIFVDVLGDLALCRATLRNNNASEGNGGAMSVFTEATVSISQSIAEYNIAALGSGGVLYLSGFREATLRGITALDNKAKNGGAIAVTDRATATVQLSNSTIRRNDAEESGGGLLVDASVTGVEMIGVQLLENSAQMHNGGAVAMTGKETFLALSDTACVNVDVLIDWTGTDKCKRNYAYEYQMTCAEVVALGTIVTDSVPVGCTCNDGYVCHSRPLCCWQ